MTLDCEITVKGDGVGRYGNPKKDRKGPLREFLVFNQVFFKKVRDHLDTCPRCDPDEAMEVYLERLRRPPTKGSDSHASATVVKFALSVEKVLSKRGRALRPEIANEFWLRSRDPRSVLARKNLCSLTELAWCYRFQESTPAGYRILQQLCGQDRTFAALEGILKGGRTPPSEDELRELLEIAEVMLS
jgi:hypothetical protein